MKKVKVVPPALALVIVTAMLFVASCSLPTEPDIEGDEGGGENEEEEVLTQEKADKFLESLSFTLSTKITGNVPAVANTSKIRVQGDTIYTLPSITMPLRLSNSQGGVVKGWYIAIDGSSFYYDVPVDAIEDSDTVSVVLIKFPEDTPAQEAPYTMPVRITPYDENGNPIDQVDTPITVEKPSSNECDILVDGDTAMEASWEWYWYWTLITDPNDKATFINAQNRVFKSVQHPTGCCNAQSACPALVCDANGTCQWTYNSAVTAETSYAIMNEFFNFYKDGTFTRFTSERKFNFDPVATDWCNQVPEYSYNFDRVSYYGTHTYTPDSSSFSYFSTRVDCDDPLGLCGYGSRGGQVIHSCHVMIIVIDRLNIEFKKETRMYVRSAGSDLWRS